MHLLSSRLVSLRLDFVSSHRQPSFPAIADYVRLVEEIMVAVPNLQQLALYGSMDSWPIGARESAGTALAELVGALPILQLLETDITPFNYLTHKHPPMTCLIQLDLKTNFQGPWPTLMDSASFPALQKVRAHYQSSNKDFWALLLSSAARTIEEIDFSTEPSRLVELLSEVGTCCVFLKVLRLSATFSEDVGLLPGFLNPLHHLTTLTQLRLISTSPRYDFSRYVTDRDVESMALAWPALEEFSLGLVRWQDQLPNDSAPSLSLRALGILCAHCPKLRSVSLTMNTDPVPTTPAQLSRPKSGPLKSLEFNLSPINDPIAIAKWLGASCVADGITFVKYTMPGGDPRIALFDQVRHIVALPQEARREGASEVEMRYKAADGGVLRRPSGC
jgi:hypothetical protein